MNHRKLLFIGEAMAPAHDRMLKVLRVFGLSVLLTGPVQAQRTDTLRFTSAAFGTERTVVVHLPEFHRYAAPEVRFPVIILLDGQHEWFAEPLCNDIRYLQYTHAVPQAITVTVPLADRVRECALDALDGPPMPLLRLLAEELPPLLEPYRPGPLQLLVGHSFSASFALYAYLQRPDLFPGVIALSPLDEVDRTIPAVDIALRTRPQDRVLIAVGGMEDLQDGGHARVVVPLMEALKPPATGDPLWFRTYPPAGHTDLPIIAAPEMLATYFSAFALRDTLVPVDRDYLLLAPPPAPGELLRSVEAGTSFRGDHISWEVAEINGMASRLLASDHTEHAIAVYRKGVELYPLFYEFHWSLGELLLDLDRQEAFAFLRRAQELLRTEEKDMQGRAEVQAEIEALMR